MKAIASKQNNEAIGSKIRRKGISTSEFLIYIVYKNYEMIIVNYDTRADQMIIDATRYNLPYERLIFSNDYFVYSTKGNQIIRLEGDKFEYGILSIDLDKVNSLENLQVKINPSKITSINHIRQHATYRYTITEGNHVVVVKIEYQLISDEYHYHIIAERFDGNFEDKELSIIIQLFSLIAGTFRIINHDWDMNPTKRLTIHGVKDIALSSYDRPDYEKLYIITNDKRLYIIKDIHVSRDMAIVEIKLNLLNIEFNKIYPIMPARNLIKRARN